MGAPLITRLRIEGFRSARGPVEIEPGPVCALVGATQAGKSNLLAAIRSALDPAYPLSRSDAAWDGDGVVKVEVNLGSGARVEVRGDRAGPQPSDGQGRPPVVFLGAAERGRGVVGRGSPPREASAAADMFAAAIAERIGPGAPTPVAAAGAAVDAVETCCAFGVRGLVLLIEEPELYLPPQSQRYLYRLLRRFAAGGNQVIYSTHSPAFLNVARLDELVFVRRRAGSGTHTFRPTRLAADPDFRALSAFDAERAEIFLSRAALLVEGQTEKRAFPFVFEALGYDADLARVSIVECGGKSGIPLFARVCDAARIPFVAVHDRDAPPGRRPSAQHRAIAASIRALAGPAHAFELAPDFEGISRIDRHGHGKPERAWRRFASLTAQEMPDPLLRAVRLVMSLAATPSPGADNATTAPGDGFRRPRPAGRGL